MKVLLLAAFVLGLDVVITEAQLQLTLTPGGESLTKSEGVNTMMTCSASGVSGDPGLVFEHNGRRLSLGTNQFSRRVSKSGNNKLKLYFSPVKQGADGTYTCKGRDSAGQEKSVSTDLVIYEALSCPGCEEFQYPVNGTDALITCPIQGSPAPTVSWIVKGKSVVFADASDRYIQRTNGMIVKQITERDNGIYECVGEVESMGNVYNSKINVSVSFKPKFVGDPKIEGYPVIRGEATMRCTATGKPHPLVKFYKITNLDSQVSGSNVVIDSFAGTMKISHLTSDYSGKYKCVAENRAGSAEIDFDFQVIEPPTLAEYTNTTADKGSDGALACYVKGNPMPTLQFQKEGVAEPYINNVAQPSDPRIRVREIKDDPLGRAGLQLMISKTTPKDSANYTCIAKNTGGEFKFNGELRIRYKPEMDKTDKSFYHWLGAVRNLTCLADAEPLPIIFQWFHNGLKIDRENGTFKLFNESKASWLQITTTTETNQRNWIFGQYSCNASNTAGSSSAVIEVKEATVPERPQAANITRITPTTISIEAEPPRAVGLGGLKLKGYQVSYKKRDEKSWEKQDFPTTQKIMVRNLVANTQYVLRVLAYNAVGTSNVAVNLEATTEKERRPYPVKVSSNPTSTTSYSYMLQWDVPLSGGSAITRYYVYYRPVNMADTTQRGTSYSGPWSKVEVKSVAAAKQRSLELKDLSENQTYEVKIEAINEHGTSDVEEPYFIFRTLTLPAHMRGPFGNLSTAAIVGILIGIIFIILIAIDVAFYFTKECGVLNTICLHFCGKGGAGKGRESMMEEGVRAGDQSMDHSDHGDEIEMDEKAPLTPGDGKNKSFPPPEDSPYQDETTPSAKASPEGSPKEHHPIIA